MSALLGMGMGFVVDVHELANGDVGIFLGGGEGLVAEEFLDGAEVGAIGEQMGSEGVAQGVGVQVPVHVGEANIFLDDAAHGALGEAAAGVIKKDGFGVRGTTAAASGAGLQQQLVTNGPVSFEGFLGFAAVRDDALLVTFAADAQHFFAAIQVGEIKAGKFADAETRGVKKFEEGAVAAQQQRLIVADARFGRSGFGGLRTIRAAGKRRGLWSASVSELVEEAV